MHKYEEEWKMKTKTLIIEAGRKCKIKAGDRGLIIDGPAIITIVNATPVESDSTGVDETYDTYTIPPLGEFNRSLSQPSS